MSSGERLRRLEQVFHRLLAESAQERKDSLAALAEEDLALASEAAKLLEAADRANAGESELEPLAAEVDAVFDDLPESLGPYRLVRLVGEGGWGRVFEAEQTEPLTKRVAIKILHPGINSRRVLKRFRREIEILNSLDHPSVTSIRDAGMTPQGLPYFVMDFVPGVPIDRYCEQELPDLAARIRLLISVCEAVHHAHSRGIMHRDLKPSNILVRGEGAFPQPVVIDFGIARALEPDEELTAVDGGGSVGTPEYMSPEQAGLLDERVDTRTDVYALGILLYRIAAGSEPQRRDGRVVPDLPHGALPAGERRELERIIGCATAHLPRDRYQSASELAADLGRFLRGEALEAGPASWTYRVRGLARQRPILTMVFAALVSTAIVGGGLSAIAFLRAESARRAEAVAARDAELVSTYLAGMLSHIDLVSAKEAERVALVGLVNTGLERLETQDLSAGSALHIRLALADALRGLHEHRAALEQYVRCREEARDLYGPASRPSCDMDARVWDAALEVSELAYIEDDPLETIRQFEHEFGRRSDEAVRARRQYALVLERRKDLSEARSRYEALASDCTQWFGPADPRTLRARHGLSVTLDRQAAEAAALGREQEAAALKQHARTNLREVRDLQRERLPPTDFDCALTRLVLARLEAEAGNVEGALSELRAVITRWQSQRGFDDKYTGWAYHTMAQILERAGDPDRAVEVWDEWLRGMEQRAGLGMSTAYLPEYGQRYVAMLERIGRDEEAERVRGLFR